MPETLAHPLHTHGARQENGRKRLDQTRRFPDFGQVHRFLSCAPSPNGMIWCHMRVPSHGHGLLRSESLFAHTPPELRCVKVIRRTGQRCKNIRVRGANCCRMHGGGTVAVKRYREELAAICAHKRGGKPRAGRLEWLLQRIARADRNRPRKHNPDYERANVAKAERLMHEVSENGATTLARRVHAAAVTLRPYRQVDCLMASARLALAWGGTRHDDERVMLVQEMASWLGVDAEERMRLGELLVPILGYRSVQFPFP